MKLHSIRVSTSACTRAYATSRLYSTLVLYRKVSKLSRPAERRKKKRKPFGISLMRSHVLYHAARLWVCSTHAAFLMHAIEGVKQGDLVAADHS